MFNLASIKNWLQCTWKLTVPEDWLSACVDWINTEHEQNRLSFEQICNMVLDQWLMCDLRDIGAHSLPENISNSPKCILQGVYVLQINLMVDVSCSLYSQVQKVKGTVNENALVNVLTQQSQYNSTQHQQQHMNNSKPSRMLLLHLHDGKQEIKAIEYSHVNSLNQSLLMGTKMLVHGKILCRRGVLFLKQENVTVIGGGVEEEEEEDGQEGGRSGNVNNTKTKALEKFLNNNITNQNALELPKKSFPSATILSFNQPPSNKNHTSAYNQNYKTNNNNNQKNRINYSDASSNGVRKVNSGTPTELNPLEDDIDDEEMMMMMMSTDDDDNDHQIKRMRLNERISGGHTDIATNNQRNRSIERQEIQPVHSNLIMENNNNNNNNNSSQNINNNKSQNCSKAFIVPYRSNHNATLKSILLKPQSGMYTVQARVHQVIGNLASNGGRYWSLKVELVDDGNVLVTDMQDRFISNLIGFDASKVKDLKKDDKTNQEIRDKMEKFMLQLFEFTTFELEVTKQNNQDNFDFSIITTKDPTNATITKFNICLKDAR